VLCICVPDLVSFRANAATKRRLGDGQTARTIDFHVWPLVHLNSDVIVTTGTPGALAAMQATKAIPIIMASSADPVAAGMLASLARPGENVARASGAHSDPLRSAGQVTIATHAPNISVFDPNATSRRIKIER
jgi:ABC-type uncharacterized transport system substrate-binding protein